MRVNYNNTSISIRGGGSSSIKDASTTSLVRMRSKNDTTTTILHRVILIIMFQLFIVSEFAMFITALKYNEIQMKSSHNSYERREGLIDQLHYHAIRSIEIDIHLGREKGIFEVYHDKGYFQSYSSISQLNIGISVLKEFHEQVPNHHVITIFMDLKEGFGIDHTPDDYDRAISALLPLWTPADAKRNATSIREGIDMYGWPDIEELRGKFIWVLTSGQETYCSSDDECNERKAFYATTSAIDDKVLSYSVIYSIPFTELEYGPKIHNAGYVSRVWHSEDINNIDKWNEAVKHQFNHITTDQVSYHRDPYLKSHNQHGFPFLSIDKGIDVTDYESDNENQIYLLTDTTDLWGLSDDVSFAHKIQKTTINEWVEYTASISVANSHCPKFAKAGLMVRKEDPDFPLGAGEYFAILRTCKDSLVRVQYRTNPYIPSISKDFPVVFDGLENSKRCNVRLRYMYNGVDTIVEGYLRFEGTGKEVLIERQVFPNTELYLHGIFASAHYWDGYQDGTDFKAMFINLQRNNETVKASDFDLLYKIKDNTFGDGFGPIIDDDKSKTSRTLRGL